MGLPAPTFDLFIPMFQSAYAGGEVQTARKIIEKVCLYIGF